MDPSSSRIGQSVWKFQTNSFRSPVEQHHVHVPQLTPSHPPITVTSINMHKPALSPSSTTQSQECLPRSCVAPSMRGLFSFEFFNKMQSTCFSALYDNSHNCVIGAPTAAGKTICFELALASHFVKNSLPTFKKALYLAPLKSIVQERLRDWKTKLNPMGFKCQEVSSDRGEDIRAENDIFLSTPEKWDAITRRWKENCNILDHIGLIMVDEVHLLGDDRGAVLEAVITRMRIHAKDHPSRIIALSASSPNVVDIGKWLNAPPQCIFYFGEEHRPITPKYVHFLQSIFSMPKMFLLMFYIIIIIIITRLEETSHSRQLMKRNDELTLSTPF
jgi:ATP-dependent helicase YprA (DUF1998 family)